MNENIKHLEEKVAYLERHVVEQDKAMLELAEDLAALRKQLKQLQARGEPGAGGRLMGDAEDLPHERPPHY